MAGNRGAREQKTGLVHLRFPSAQNGAWGTVGAQRAYLVTERSETIGERHSRQREHHTQKLGGATDGLTHVGDKKYLPRTEPQEARGGVEPTDSSERPWTGEKALPKFRHSPLVMGPEPEAWGLTFNKHVLQPRPCRGSFTHMHM